MEPRNVGPWAAVSWQEQALFYMLFSAPAAVFLLSEKLGAETCFHCRWVKATVVGLKDSGRSVLVKAEVGWEAELLAGDCHVQNERDDTLDDLVKSDYLHEAG